MSLTRQAEAVSISRGSVYYPPRPVSDADLALMRRMGIEALYRKPNTSRRNGKDAIYPYLLRTLKVERPTRVLARWTSPTSRWPRASSIWPR